MIITVTINPMVEHFFPVSGLAVGRAFRPAESYTFATGKPLNVARALNDLGEEVVAVVAAGGRRGREIEERLLAERIPHRIVAVRRENRVGVTLYGGGHATTVYGPVLPMSDPDVEAIVAAVRGLLPARCLVIGGSTPRPELHTRLCALGVPVGLDICGPTLDDALRYGNILVAKPNRQECLDTLCIDDPQAAARELARRGARWAVVTDGGGPAIFRTGGRVFRVTPPAVEVRHAVGSGDALLAGLLHAMPRGPTRAMAFAVACGSHSAGRPGVAQLDPGACEILARQIHVQEITPGAAAAPS